MAEEGQLAFFRDYGFHIVSSKESGVHHITFSIAQTKRVIEKEAARESSSTIASLRYILSPRSVAVIGASRDPGSIGNVLFPVDFSEYSKMAVKKGMRLISQFDAKPTLLFVVEQQHPLHYLQSFEPILKANPALKEQLMKNLKAIAGSQKAAFHLAEGKPHKQIEAYAEAKNIDLIIIASHGMSGLEHFLIGSTTERVVNVAPCPVLTIPVRSQQKT